MPALMCGSETMIWEEKERSRIRADHMDSLRFVGHWEWIKNR